MGEIVNRKTNLLDIIPKVYGSVDKFCQDALSLCEDRVWCEKNEINYENVQFRNVAEKLCEMYIRSPRNIASNLSSFDFEGKVPEVYPNRIEDFYKEALEISLNNDWHVNNFPNNSLFDAQYFLYKKYLNKNKTQN